MPFVKGGRPGLPGQSGRSGGFDRRHVLVGIGHEDRSTVERFRAAGAAPVTKAFDLQLVAVRIHTAHVLRANDAEDAGRAFKRDSTCRVATRFTTAPLPGESRLDAGCGSIPMTQDFCEGLDDGLLAAECERSLPPCGQPPQRMQSSLVCQRSQKVGESRWAQSQSRDRSPSGKPWHGWLGGCGSRFRNPVAWC